MGLSEKTERLDTVLKSNDLQYIETYIEDINRERQHNKTSVSEAEVKLMALSERVQSVTRSGRRLPSGEYDSICKKQLRLRQHMEIMRQELGCWHALLRKAEDRRRELTHARALCITSVQTKDNGMLERLHDLAKEYEDFAQDHTRVASMRMMASQFVVKLRAAIRGGTAVCLPNTTNQPPNAAPTKDGK